MLMGCYKEKGEYYYSLISSVTKMAEHQDKEYCVICEVSSFNITERNEENEKIVPKEKPAEDKWYKEGEIEFELVGLTEKFFSHEDDPKDKSRKGIWRQYDNHGNVSRIISKRKEVN